MKTLRKLGMALMAVLLCVNFAACSGSEEEELDKEDLSTYHKTSLKVNGMQYLVRLEHSYYTPDMWANIFSSNWGAEFGINGVREDGLTVSPEGDEIPTPLKSNSNIGEYTKLWCCLWNDVGSFFEYNSGTVTIQDNGNNLTIKFSNAVYNLADADASEELKKHSKQTLNGTITITGDKIYRE